MIFIETRRLRNTKGVAPDSKLRIFSRRAEKMTISTFKNLLSAMEL